MPQASFALPYPAISLEALIELGASDTLVLTVNNRLARTLKAQVAQQITTGATELPGISPWTSWLTNQVIEKLYQGGHDSFSQVLDTQTVRLLWGQAIAKCEAQRSLIDIDQVAAIAADADALMLNWAIDVPDAWHTPDFSRFLQWRQAYEDQLQRLDAVDVPRVAAPVARWIASGELHVPKHVVLMGFTDCSASMQHVLDALVAAGVQVFQLKWLSTQGAAVVSKVSLATPAQQWLAAIDWARCKLTEHPQGRFAIVAPSLQAEASQARRLLARGLDGMSYNVAVAPPLAQWPLARAMLSWLRVIVDLSTHAQIEPSVAGQALLAGACAGSETEAGARAMLDARWRHKQWLVMSQASWLEEIKRAARLSAAWNQAWTQWQTLSPHSASWYDWANTFRAVLAALGFPGDGTQTSVQYQVSSALDQLISSLAALDDCLDAPDAQGAWHMLSRLASQTLFQPQRDADARLDVLGLLEAEGGHWDGVWVMGVTDDVLPAVVNPNPLIPVQALANAGAPRSTAKREHQWAAELMQALQQAGDEVIFSWAERDGEQPNRPSPFLADLPLMSLTSLNPPNACQIDEQTPEIDRVPLVAWTDEPSLEVTADEFIGGGVSVLQTQAANPLWAFFQYRLKARGLPAYAQWPSMQDRGNVLHRVMELLWNQWGNQSRMLDAIRAPEWTSELEQLVAKVASEKLAQWPPALRELEQQRALEVLDQWLAFEASREPFTVIEREGKHDFLDGALRLGVTIDRIDELADGQRIVFDYKSGVSLPRPDKDWQSMSFKNPQLLVYACVLHDQGKEPDALGWIRLHASGVAIEGVSATDTGVPGVKAWVDLKWPELEWPAQMAQWQTRVRGLAQQFAQGQHENITWQRDDLKYCTIKPLLRLHVEVDDE